MHGNTEEEKLFVFRMRGGVEWRKIDGPRDRKYYSRFLDFRSPLFDDEYIASSFFFFSFFRLMDRISGREYL